MSDSTNRHLGGPTKWNAFWTSLQVGANGGPTCDDSKYMHTTRCLIMLKSPDGSPDLVPHAVALVDIGVLVGNAAQKQFPGYLRVANF